MNINVLKKGWVNNLKELTISSPYGPRWGRFHRGIDIAIEVGTKILAPASGVIIKKQVQRNGAGLYIVLRFKISNSEFYDIYFMHLSKTDVYVGKVVNAGDLIALSGGMVGDVNAGSSTGPHLHFEIRINGTQHTNPIYFLQEKLVLKNGETFYEGSKGSITKEFLIKKSRDVDEDVSSYTDDNATERNSERKIVQTRKPSIDERLAPGIWQIVKLIMDSSVANRQMFDSSISFQTGPLINFFNKVCQKPLVEFSGDTYGDQYYFMIRKLPFDKESIEKMQDLTLNIIPNGEIISTNLSWNTSGIYSWYQMIPFAEFAGMDQLNLFMPAIFFPEYAAVWGSKDLTVQNQYVNYYHSGKTNAETDKDKNENMSKITRNAAVDLKYLVESNAYNPFVRHGSITLIGDRRIKRGTLILMPNGEQFYVESVSNDFSVTGSSVNRTTTLQVSHGMFQEYIHGVEIDGNNMSYFNIIDFGDWKPEKITAENWKEQISKWKVNIAVFAFFLKRSQILSTYNKG